MAKNKRKYKSEIVSVMALRIEPISSSGAKPKDKPPSSVDNPSQVFETKTILGIIERIKKL